MADQSYRSFLRLNLLCFITILQLACAELQHSTNEDHTDIAHHVKLSAQQSHLLVLMRLYNLWLLKNTHVIARPLDANFVDLHARFWQAYAAMLNVLVEKFRHVWLPGCPYLLGEDLDTIAFMPLHSASTSEYWFSNSERKPAFYDVDSAMRDEKDDLYRIGCLTEMAARLVEVEVRDFFVVKALSLTQKNRLSLSTSMRRACVSLLLCITRSKSSTHLLVARTCSKQWKW